MSERIDTKRLNEIAKLAFEGPAFRTKKGSHNRLEVMLSSLDISTSAFKAQLNSLREAFVDLVRPEDPRCFTSVQDRLAHHFAHIQLDPSTTRGSVYVRVLGWIEVDELIKLCKAYVKKYGQKRKGNGLRRGTALARVAAVLCNLEACKADGHDGKSLRLLAYIGQSLNCASVRAAADIEAADNSDLPPSFLKFVCQHMNRQQMAVYVLYHIPNATSHNLVTVEGFCIEACGKYLLANTQGAGQSSARGNRGWNDEEAMTSFPFNSITLPPVLHISPVSLILLADVTNPEQAAELKGCLENFSSLQVQVLNPDYARPRELQAAVAAGGDRVCLCTIGEQCHRRTLKLIHRIDPSVHLELHPTFRSIARNLSRADNMDMLPDVYLLRHFPLGPDPLHAQGVLTDNIPLVSTLSNQVPLSSGDASAQHQAAIGQMIIAAAAIGSLDGVPPPYLDELVDGPLPFFANGHYWFDVQGQDGQYHLDLHARGGKIHQLDLEGSMTATVKQVYLALSRCNGPGASSSDDIHGLWVVAHGLEQGDSETREVGIIALEDALSLGLGEPLCRLCLAHRIKDWHLISETTWVHLADSLLRTTQWDLGEEDKFVAFGTLRIRFGDRCTIQSPAVPASIYARSLELPTAGKWQAFSPVPQSLVAYFPSKLRQLSPCDLAYTVRSSEGVLVLSFNASDQRFILEHDEQDEIQVKPTWPRIRRAEASEKFTLNVRLPYLVLHHFANKPFRQWQLLATVVDKEVQDDVDWLRQDSHHWQEARYTYEDGGYAGKNDNSQTVKQLMTLGSTLKTRVDEFWDNFERSTAEETMVLGADINSEGSDWEDSEGEGSIASALAQTNLEAPAPHGSQDDAPVDEPSPAADARLVGLRQKVRAKGISDCRAAEYRAELDGRETTAEHLKLLIHDALGVDNLTAERKKLLPRTQKLETELKARTAELLRVQEKLEAANATVDTFESEREAAVSERNIAVSERDAAVSERNVAVSERDAAISQCNAATSDRNTAVSERNAAISERNAAISERDAAVSSLETRTTERNVAVSERDAACVSLSQVQNDLAVRITERDNAVSERDAAHLALSQVQNNLAVRTTERDEAVSECDDAVSLLSQIRNDLVVCIGERGDAVSLLSQVQSDLAACIGERDAVQGERNAALSSLSQLGTDLSARTRERDAAFSSLLQVQGELAEQKLDCNTLIQEVCERESRIAAELQAIQQRDQRIADMDDEAWDSAVTSASISIENETLAQANNALEAQLGQAEVSLQEATEWRERSEHLHALAQDEARTAFETELETHHLHHVLREDRLRQALDTELANVRTAYTSRIDQLSRDLLSTNTENEEALEELDMARTVREDLEMQLRLREQDLETANSYYVYAQQREEEAQGWQRHCETAVQHLHTVRESLATMQTELAQLRASDNTEVRTQEEQISILSAELDASHSALTQANMTHQADMRALQEQAAALRAERDHHKRMCGLEKERADRLKQHYDEAMTMDTRREPPAAPIIAPPPPSIAPVIPSTPAAGPSLEEAQQPMTVAPPRKALLAHFQGILNHPHRRLQTFSQACWPHKRMSPEEGAQAWHEVRQRCLEESRIPPEIINAQSHLKGEIYQDILDYVQAHRQPPPEMERDLHLMEAYCAWLRRRADAPP
ncbi:PROTEIN BASIC PENTACYSTEINE4-RELATED [Ceraceosorus bombacis]|uniref:PROTEIN BASIC PENTACYSTEINE4-RELATED n=1 Tax=Ceraceosorus bombacis TaxID=401625 RepID=A0A0P1BKX7_9BASI|nr:PROTEIN BASIC PENTACYSTEINE4-RELATED [Ceraceosorus bombacis]